MSTQKDRLIQAAELLGMTPDDLLTMLDRRTEADAMLSAARKCDAEGLEGHALRRYRKLDEMLTRGGRLPEAWAPAVFAEREAARAEAVALHLPTDVPVYEVGDPDPTPSNEGGTHCRGEDGSGFLCTWRPGHDGDHVAGDSRRVCAVWSQ